MKTNQRIDDRLTGDRLARKLGSLLVVLLLAGLTACGGDKVQNRDDQPPADSGPATFVLPEVVQFRDTVYNGKNGSGISVGVLRLNCKNCHVNGNTSPAFADGDVNVAYASIYNNTAGNGQLYADLTTAADSRLVSKVASGHNCWSSDCAADAAEMQAQIEDWITAIAGGGTGGGGGGGGGPTTPVKLIDTLPAPADIIVNPPEASKSLPDAGDPAVAPTGYDSSPTAATSIHGLLKVHCSECHTSTSSTPQTPFLADADAADSYVAISSAQKIDINNPNKSRVYVRLADNFHNCWSDCATNAAEILAAVTAFAATIPDPADIDAAILPSKALTLGEGQVISGGVRYEANIIAKYEFKDDTSQRIAEDTSGIDPALNLTLNDNVDWVSGWGLEFRPGGNAFATIAASKKLHGAIVNAAGFSIEAWVVPSNVTQGENTPASIVSYSAGQDQRNMTLGQQLYNYTSAVRIDNANADMAETLSTPDAAESLQATQQHVVMTYDSANGRSVYVNGELASVSDDGTISALRQWDPGFILSLGADADGNNGWLGKIRLLAFHNAVLTDEQILQNFEAGVGQKFNLLFKIGDLDDAGNDFLPDTSYLWFVASEFDNFSYHFSDPKFVILGLDDTDTRYTTVDDVTTLNNTVNIKGLKLGLNGKEVEVGQVYANMDTNITNSPQSLIPTVTRDFGDGEGDREIPVAATGTIIAKQNGSDGASADQFFISIEALDGIPGKTASVTIDTISYSYNSGPGYVIGLRTFDELNVSMSELTGIPATTGAVVTAFGNLKQQLPSSEAMKTFLPSVQMSIANLAGVYCQELVESSSLRSGFFGVPESFFTTNPGTVDSAFGTGLSANKLSIVNALVTKITGQDALGDPQQLTIQPAATDVRDALIGSDGNSGLYGTLQGTCAASGCTQDADRVRTVVKGMCMAVLGSAAVSQQ